MARNIEMTENMKIEPMLEPELTDADILDAMQHIPGYLDISTRISASSPHLAWQHAMARLRARQQGGSQ